MVALAAWNKPNNKLSVNPHYYRKAVPRYTDDEEANDYQISTLCRLTSETVNSQDLQPHCLDNCEHCEMYQMMMRLRDNAHD